MRKRVASQGLGQAFAPTGYHDMKRRGVGNTSQPSLVMQNDIGYVHAANGREQRSTREFCKSLGTMDVSRA
jgi:hypothetical protein